MDSEFLRHGTVTSADMASTDTDQEELDDWRAGLEGLVAVAGKARTRAVLDMLLAHSHKLGVGWNAQVNTPYVNTISTQEEPDFPGDLAIEQRLAAMMRWNALAMVVKANRAFGELGGHISSYASAADLFEVGFNHFFRASASGNIGDLIYYQPHSAPGIYARAFLDGRISSEELDLYRQEITANSQSLRGLSSYPHPWLMKDFWQFPTGSMGIGPISSIYQARFSRYLQNRGLLERQVGAERRVWGVFGDGEMDEPESMAALTLAARESLDNLTWVINCNLQRLDGPVRGNGRIIDELEALFRGAGWNVIKLLWGSDWDGLLARDRTGALASTFGSTVDGQLQTFAAKDGRYNRDHFFGQSPELARLAAGLTDDQIDRLKRGGHDIVKIFAAYDKAVKCKGRPTVILAQTKKGFGMGSIGQGKMTTHQQKKLSSADLLAFRDRLELPISDASAISLEYYRPDMNSEEMRYLQIRRQALGGVLPVRNADCAILSVPAIGDFATFAVEANGKQMSTTVAFVRMLSRLLTNNHIGERIVPIVADEARTFGMASLFKRFGIYASSGQHYEPEDIDSVMSYSEAQDGQILEEGISEAGALSSWVAAGTSYSTHGTPMLPFYIYYSMFGFQRVGDLIWAAADQRARGFLLGATSGRTTLAGEGLQHQDGGSLVSSAMIPNCRSYELAFAYEVAVVVHKGMNEMLREQRDVFYYLTLANESYSHPSLPVNCESDLLKGMYRVSRSNDGAEGKVVRLLGSGSLLPEVLEAAKLLEQDWGILGEIWSVTSYSELARDAQSVQRSNRLHPNSPPSISHVQSSLEGNAPIIAVSDFVRAWPGLIAPYVQERISILGTDGFGRSDTREVLRRFFEIDRYHIAVTALYELCSKGTVPSESVETALKKYNIDTDSLPSWEL